MTGICSYFFVAFTYYFIHLLSRFKILDVKNELAENREQKTEGNLKINHSYSQFTSMYLSLRGIILIYQNTLIINISNIMIAIKTMFI